jgi:hypothetical protein
MIAMPIITPTREDILGYPLEEERHTLLQMVDRLDVDGGYQDNKYVKPLLKKRLAEIEEERTRLDLARSDPDKYAEVLAEIEDETLRFNSQ